jgi:hypothetical protein
VLNFTATDVITFKVNLNTLSVNGGGTGSLVKGVKKFSSSIPHTMPTHK